MRDFTSMWEEVRTTIWKSEKEKMKPEDLGIQNVFTPVEKIEEVCNIKFADFVTSEMKEVAILFNVEFLQNLIKYINKDYISNIHFTFFYDSEWDLKHAKEVTEVDEVNVDFISIIEFSKSKDVKDLVKAMGTKHFDIVFSNPPYGENGQPLHLHILDNILKISKNVIFIHPDNWLFKTRFKNKFVNSFRSNVDFEKRLSEIIHISCNIFDGGCLSYMNLCITFWTNFKNDNILIKDKIFNINYSKNLLNEINQFSWNNDWDNYVKNIKIKIDNYINSNGSFSDHEMRYNDDRYKQTKLTEFGIWLSDFRGNACSRIVNGKYNKSFCTSINQNENDNIINPTQFFDKNAFIVLNSNNEIRNVINYLNTKIARFSQAIYKTDGHLYRYDIPWFDFSRSWTDEDLCKELGITEEEWNYIDKYIEV